MNSQNIAHTYSQYLATLKTHTSKTTALQSIDEYVLLVFGKKYSTH